MNSHRTKLRELEDKRRRVAQKWTVLPGAVVANCAPCGGCGAVVTLRSLEVFQPGVDGMPGHRSKAEIWLCQTCAKEARR